MTSVLVALTLDASGRLHDCTAAGPLDLTAAALPVSGEMAMLIMIWEQRR